MVRAQMKLVDMAVGFGSGGKYGARRCSLAFDEALCQVLEFRLEVLRISGGPFNRGAHDQRRHRIEIVRGSFGAKSCRFEGNASAARGGIEHREAVRLQLPRADCNQFLSSGVGTYPNARG